MPLKISRKGAKALCLALAFLEAILLLLYFTQTNVGLTLPGWLASFRLSPDGLPFSLKSFLGIWLSSLASLAAYGGWLAVAWILGTPLLRKIGVKAAPKQSFILSMGLGLGTLSLLFFFLGLAHLYYRPTALMVALAILFWGVREARHGSLGRTPTVEEVFRPGIPFRERRGEGHLEPVSLALAYLGLLCAGTLAFHLLGAFLPPSSFDELNYQLALPKLYHINHGLVLTPYNHLSYLPRNMGMLFELGLLSGGPTLAKLFSWGMGVSAAAALYIFGRDCAGRRAAALAAALFFLTPVVGNQLRIANADLGTAFYELCAAFLLLKWLDKPGAPILVLSSIFWGLALGCKYSAAPGFLSGLLIVLWRVRRKPDAAATAAAYLIPAMLLWSPWLAWNWWTSGNPVNPVFSSLIRSRNFYFAGIYQPLVDYAGGIGIANYFPIATVRDAVLLPWHLVASHNDFNHDLGPAWLLLPPVLVLLALDRRRMPDGMRACAVLCALYWLFWLGGHIRMARYFAAGLGLTALLAGWAISSSLDVIGAMTGRPKEGPGARDNPWLWVILMPLLAALTQQGMRVIYIQNTYKKPWGYLAGKSTLRDYLEGIQTDFSFDAMSYINRRLPKESRVLVFDEFRTFYLNRDFIASTPWDHDYWHETVRVSRSQEDILDRLRRRGVGYFLVNDDYVLHQTGKRLLDGWTPQEWLHSVQFWNRHVEKLFYGDDGVWVGKIQFDKM